MKVKDLIRKLSAFDENQDVMFQDGKDDSIFSILRVTKTVSNGGYPDDWDMPEGYKFILLEN